MEATESNAPAFTESRVSITSTFEIAAAHRLPYHTGKCKRRHGHNYRLEFTCSGEVQGGTGPEAGMVRDFGDMDAEIKAVLEEHLDHYELNQVAGLENPTAEHLALWLLDKLPRIEKVVVWETGRHCVTAERKPLDLYPAFTPNELRMQMNFPTTPYSGTSWYTSTQEVFEGKITVTGGER